MGILPGVQHHRRSPAPDTPPGLVSPTSSSYSTTRSEASSWRRTGPPSPPMSSYGRQSPADMVKSERSTEDTRTPSMRDTPAGQTSAPRQQLPSLSSLFGPPPPARPAHSPLSEHPPVFGAHSPLDGRPPTSVSLEGRSYSSSSYFPPSNPGAALSQPRSSYDTRYDDRPSIPPLSRPSYPGPHSPHVREPEHHRGGSGSDYSTGSKWSLPHEASSSRSEYTLGSSRDVHGGPPPFKSMPLSSHDRHDPYRPQLPSLTHTNPSHDISDRDAALYLRPPIVPGTLPPTPSSAVSSSEGGNPLTSGGVGGAPGSQAVKDGLGPKIWTGSHFLPRFVRAAEVAGEGLCYFYDDGSYCKTVIDGEAVNAHWGVTKAGKPRKRLAIACVTCREKKIKCDPDYPRCVQCEKFGRVCRFKNAPRGGHNSPSTPPAELDQPRRLGVLIRPPLESPRPGSTSSASVSPRTTVRPASPEPLLASAKRMRTGYDHYYPAREGPGSSSTGAYGGNHSPTAGHGYSPTHARAPPLESSSSRIVSMPLPWQQPDLRLPRIHEDVLHRAWQKDPYVTDPQSVSSALLSSLSALDAAALRFVPKGHFMAWLAGAPPPPTSAPAPAPPQAQDQKLKVPSAHTKSAEDLMFVYSALALGAARLAAPGGESVANEYAQVARFATERVEPCLQLVQTRLMLTVYYAAVDRLREAGEMMGLAVSTAFDLRMNVELDYEEAELAGSKGKSKETEAAARAYGLGRGGFAECRRRTFWACFIWERFHGLVVFPNRPASINQRDIFLRLPCVDTAFDDVSEVDNIKAIVDLSTATPDQIYELGRGIMVHALVVAALWEDTISTIYRTAHRLSLSESFPAFHEHTTRRLKAWLTSIPARLADTEALSAPGVNTEDKAAMLASYMLYHLALLTLNRYAPLSCLDDEGDGPQKIDRELCMHNAAEQALEILDLAASPAFSAFTSTPLITYAVHEAADVLTTWGALPDLMNPDRGMLSRIRRLRPNQLTPEVVARVGALEAMLAEFDRDGTRMGTVAGVRVFLPDEEREHIEKKHHPGKSPREQSLVWRFDGPLGGRFPRHMDVVHGSLPKLPTGKLEEQ